MSLNLRISGKAIASSPPITRTAAAAAQSIPLLVPPSGDHDNKPENLPAPQPSIAPKSLCELLSALESEKDYGMMRTTAQYFSEYKQVPLEQLMIDDLDGMAANFKEALRKKAPYTKNSIRSFGNYLQRLVAHAKRLGWVPTHRELEESWKDIILAMATDGSRAIPRFAVRTRIAAGEFTDADLDRWEREFLEKGGSYNNAERIKASFRRAVAQSGMRDRLPKINCASQGRVHYSDPFALLPEQWRADIELVIQTKQAKYAPGRGKRIRPITGKNLKQGFIRYCGYLTKVAARKDLSNVALPQLFTRELVIGYINFCLNNRGLKGDSVRNLLRLIHAALKCHPAYNAQDFSWFASVVSEIEPEPPSAKFTRKMQKYVDYELLGQIKFMILQKRKEAAKIGDKAVAWLFHDALLVSWLVTLVWRGRNVREIRVGHNLFRASLPPLVQMTIPGWAREKLKKNANELFWQFRFSEDETKAARSVHCILPLDLIPLLEEYLTNWRPLLVCSTNPGNLFLNRAGGALTSGELRDLVSNLTLKYAKRRVNPHMIRDIYVYWWLSQYPEDINTVSKMLWHKNIQTTINIYGWKYDESAALCRVEELRELRRFESQQRTAEKTRIVMPATSKLGQAASVDPRFSRCLRCGESCHVNPRGYCSPDCEDALGLRSETDTGFRSKKKAA